MSELVYVNFLHRIVRGKRERSLGLIFTVDYTCSAVISKTSILFFFSYVVLTTYSRRALPESVVFLVLGRQVWFLLVFVQVVLVACYRFFSQFNWSDFGEVPFS